jgi:hypothetical protein
MSFHPGFRGKGAGFPIVQATATTTVTLTTTGSGNINLPSGIVANDLLIVLVRYGNTTISFPAGWTQLFDGLEGNSTVKMCAFYARAAGGETTVAPTVGANTGSTEIAYRISDAFGTPEAASVNGISTSADPPSLTPSWGTKKTLWLAAAIDQVNAITGTPTNYINQLAAPNSTLVSAQRDLEASSDDPSTYTLNPSQGWRSGTIATRGP